MVATKIVLLLVSAAITTQAHPNARLTRALPPAYLGVSGWEDCLESYQLASGRLLCLPPSTYPRDLCPENTYETLTTVFLSDGGIVCPVQDAGEPLNVEAEVDGEYLAIVGHERCLETFQASLIDRLQCLPPIKASDCDREVFDQLQGLFTGPACPDFQPSIPVRQEEPEVQEEIAPKEEVAPQEEVEPQVDVATDEVNEEPALLGADEEEPAYLSIDVNGECLQTFDASKTHREYCLPKGRPINCDREVYEQLEEEFKDQICPVNFDCPRKCPKLQSPVCGTDNKSYANQCLLRKENCRSLVEITVAARGNCQN